MSGTLKVVAGRLLGALPNLVGVVIITFLLTRALPATLRPTCRRSGDAGSRRPGASRAGPGQEPARAVFLYVGGLLRGDFGTSLRPASRCCRNWCPGCPASIEMVLLALTLGLRHRTAAGRDGGDAAPARGSTSSAA
jgi:peptide/nickel transport system permease protein